MKKVFNFLLIFFINIYASNSQNPSDGYRVFVKKADSCFIEKNYEKAIGYYNQAFAANNGLGTVRDRYKMAISFVKLQNYDSAFTQLFRITERGKFSDIDLISGDLDFEPLHKDSRWQLLLNKVMANKKTKENE